MSAARSFLLLFGAALLCLAAARAGGWVRFGVACVIVAVFAVYLTVELRDEVT